MKQNSMPPNRRRKLSVNLPAPGGRRGRQSAEHSAGALGIPDSMPPNRRRKLSVKLKLTLWFTAFMAGTAGLCLGLILMINGQVARSETLSVLTITVRDNLSKVHLTQGVLDLDQDFRFYRNEVYLMLYNKNKALLTGETPPGFPVSTPLENGVTKTAAGDGEDFYVFDLWIPSGWEDGLWLRGVIQSPDGHQSLNQIFTMFAIILPFVILLAAVGGYWIARRALRPIEQITQTAESIEQGKDLSRRLNLPAGSDEAGRLGEAFDRMFSRLEKSFEAEKQSASDASHELRTPTAVILAQCAYMEKYGSKPADYQEGIAVIRRKAQKMSDLINHLLDMTRFDFGTRKIQTEDTDLSAMTEILCQEQDTGLKGITIRTRIPEGIHAQIDPHLMSRVIENLLDNARKYGRENGWIQVSLSQKSDKVYLEVEDNGIGIAPEDLEKIWQRFYQANPSRESGSGLGLGLSMVRQIAQLHGGWAKAESRLGEGSRFTIILPVSQPL